jgi:hypothetical protein
VCGEKTFAAGAGSFVYVPSGTVHSFTNVGETPGSLLVLSTPAGGTEGFFFEVGEPATDGSSPPPTSGIPDVAKLKQSARMHGSDIDTLSLLRQLTVTLAPEQKGE